MKVKGLKKNAIVIEARQHPCGTLVQKDSLFETERQSPCDVAGCSTPLMTKDHSANCVVNKSGIQREAIDVPERQQSKRLLRRTRFAQQGLGYRTLGNSADLRLGTSNFEQ